jgi:23S rRNA-intervening sequence protein
VLSFPLPVLHGETVRVRGSPLFRTLPAPDAIRPTADTDSGLKAGHCNDVIDPNSTMLHVCTGKCGLATDLPRIGTSWRMDNARRTGPAVEAQLQLINWLMPVVEDFPRAQKFLLGDRLQSTALDVLEALIEATYTRERRGPLARANLGLEKLRFFIRIANDQKHLDHRRYEHAAKLIDDVGRLIGGWAKADAVRSQT